MNTKEALKSFKLEMAWVLYKHQEQKGDSWLTCDIKFLESKLVEEIDEYKCANSPLQKSQELVDIANICMMLYHRHNKIWIKKVDTMMRPKCV